MAMQSSSAAAQQGEADYNDSKRKGKSVKKGLRRRARDRGMTIGGGRPFGYVDNHLDAFVPHEVETVRRIFDESVAGRSQGVIARALNDDKIRTGRGSSWTQASVRGILTNPIYMGKVRCNDEVYDGAHEGIVSEETWDAAEKIRELVAGERSDRYRGAAKGSNNGGGQKARGRHLFTQGLLRCGLCGESMIPRTRVRTTGPDTEFYRCRGRHTKGTSFCTQGSVPRVVVDEAILTELDNRYLDVEATRARLEAKRDSDSAIADAARTGAQTEARRAEDRLARVVRAFQDGHLEAEDYGDQRAGLIAERDAALGAIEDIEKRMESFSKIDTAEVETILRLAELRAAVLGQLDDAPDLDALRTLLRQIFRAVYYQPIIEGHWSSQIRVAREGSLPLDGAVLMLHPRVGGIAHPGIAVERHPLPVTETSKALARPDDSDVSVLFAPVPVRAVR